MGSTSSKITPVQYEKVYKKNKVREGRMQLQRDRIDFAIQNLYNEFTSDPIYPDVIKEYNEKGFQIEKRFPLDDNSVIYRITKTNPD